MSTEMVPSQPSQNRQTLTYAQLFATRESKTAQIKRATTRLGVATGKALDSSTLEIWAQNLESYSSEQLTAAFVRAEGEVAAFPAVAHLKAYLDRAEFDAALALVLKGIRRHGPAWEDREAWKESDTWDYHSAEAIALGDRIKIVGKVHAPEPAPTIPPRMVKALELFGQEFDFRTGLKRLYRDSPVYWDGSTERETGQHGRQAAQIERDLFLCWLRAQ